MKIAIIGHGFVGKAVDYGFTHSKVEKTIIDPKYGSTIDQMSKKELEECEFAFVCAPTPMGEKGEVDSSIVESVINYLHRESFCTIILKSTVTPDVIDKLKYSHDRLVYNPEFLTEKNAQEQFVNPPFHILGGRHSWEVLDLYENYSLCSSCQYFHMTAKEASFVKYGINTFLATKVTFFNQLLDACEADGDVHFNVISRAIGADPRIGTGHTKVPGYDGKKGFGGACFPKDTSAWVNYFPESTLLQEVIQTNNQYRSQYELDDREKEQHIRYGDD